MEKFIQKSQITKIRQNNEFKISAPTWNEELQLPDGSYSV